jgi:hypothetical protein
MELIQSKSLLAKLMATENLIVEQRNVQTASFDVKNRVLTVPVLDKNISGYLYDLFMGHEVGHALYTPLDGLIKAHEEKIPSGIMNVCEDARIKKKNKNKYPGIRSSFIRAYKELIDKDFFGTAGTDLNDLNFIDRVNLYTKGGATQGIKFTPYEQTLVHMIEGTETYDDVMRVARLVAQYMKEQAEEHKKNHPEEFEEDEDGDYEGIDSDGYDDSEDWDDETETRQDNNNSGEENPNTEENDQESESDSGNQAGGTEVSEHESLDTKSYTDEAFRRNEKKLYATDGSTHYYGNIPKVDLADAIVTHKVLWKRYRESADSPYAYKKGIDTEKFMKLRNDSKKVVGYLAKEFELRKNADQLKRASVAKTGDLNMSKIYAYQLTDDIFKKMTVVPGAKSHGLVMFLDWSGSMSNHLENTIKQLINLVMFCKKVNIPYDVYAFSAEYDEPYKQTPTEGDVVMRNFKLLNLLSSKMTAAEFTYAGSALVQMSEYRRGWKPNWFQKGGTPLNEAVISAMTIVPEFQKQYKLQIVNTVFLTDGEGHTNREVFYKDNKGIMRDGTTNKEIDYDSIDWRAPRKMVLRDPITKNQEILDYSYNRELTASYIKMLKARTNCNIVGFYVLAGRELGRELHYFYPNNYMLHDKIKAEFRKNKSLTVTNAGFDEYYLLKTEALDTDDDVSFEVKENATTRGLVSAFSKFAGNRLNNRVVLNRFIGLIS